jgi:hypothetical protein
MSGGTFSFTIYTTEPVTLVPWCDSQPRITRTEPRNDPNGPSFSNASEIVLYFNCALDPGTVKFAENENADGIWITANGESNKDNEWYNNPEYNDADGFFTVTINPKVTLPPEGKVTVTVKGIKNMQLKSMALYSFSWNTSSAGAYFTYWNAKYEPSENAVKVNCRYENADSIVMYYRLNGGPNTMINNKETDDYNFLFYLITGVPLPDDSGLLKGRQTSGIREYKIFMELYSEGVMMNRVSFKIWNIPIYESNNKIWTAGMSVDNYNIVKEIRTEAELAAIKDNLSGQYVLVNDITVSNPWTPVGTSASLPNASYVDTSAAFKGKFFGNGHTITLNNGFNASTAYAGLFGYVGDNVVIRDLSLVFNGNTKSSTVWSFGGVAGNVVGNSIHICNIITGGNIKVELNGNTEYKQLGGITGFMSVDGFGPLVVNNCMLEANIDLTVGGNGNIYVGGVAGYSFSSYIDNINSSGDIKYSYQIPKAGHSSVVGGIIGEGVQGNLTNSIVKSSFNLNTASELVKVGGIVGNVEKIEGLSTSFNISNTYAEDKPTEINSPKGIIISVTSANLNLFVGGIVGYIADTSNIDGVHSNFNEINISTHSNTTGTSKVYIGGIVGRYVANPINGSYSNTNIIVNSLGKEIVYAGGLIGIMEGSAALTNCYALGDVFVDRTYDTPGAGNICAGGLVGYMNLSTGNSIGYSFSTGTVRAKTKSGAVYVGGILGYNENTATGQVRNCAALGKLVTAQGGGIKEAARICGYSSSSYTGGSNYAINSMIVWKDIYQDKIPDPSYTPYPDEEGNIIINHWIEKPPPESLSPVVSDNAGLLHGKDTPLNDFRKIDFWTDPNILAFNCYGPVSTLQNLKYANIWDFSSLTGRGYPKLRNQTEWKE